MTAVHAQTHDEGTSRFKGAKKRNKELTMQCKPPSRRNEHLLTPNWKAFWLMNLSRQRTEEQTGYDFLCLG